MNPSRIFILRPIATTLLMVAICVIGWMGYRSLPIAALPQVDYPTIQIVTLYPGAHSDVVASAITVPLERQLGQISGLKNMHSQSLSGASVITLQFDLSLDMTVADQSVQAAISIANKWLPSDLPSPPVYNKVNPADPPILTLAITSTSMPMTRVQDIVDTRIAQSLSQVSGVGLVTLAGGQRPAIRVDFIPEALASMGLSVEQIRTAINSANTNSPKGGFDNNYRTISISANDQIRTPEAYASLIVATVNGAPVRLQDVAKISEGPENEQLQAWSNLEQAILINIQRQPSANVIDTVDHIKYMLPGLAENLPKDIQITVLNDRTDSIRASVSDVKFELVLAIVLVVAVIFVFLRNVRATIIPGIAVPLSLIGTFAVMYSLGYSINNLTLMAMTIATGFVVDDAIVVVENISRYIEKGYSPLEAALKGSQEIAFTIVSLTISLIAVLIPLLFMQDLIGRLFREFAVTLAVAILISGFISLTLSPMMCAKFLKSEAEENKGKLYHYGEVMFDKMIAFYGRTLKVVLQFKFIVLMVAIGTFVLTVLLFWFIPKGFFPNQDNGVIQVFTQARQSISYSGMVDKQQELIDKILQDPDVKNTSAFVGVDGINPSTNVGRILINLKPLEERNLRAKDIMQRLQTAVAEVPGVDVYFQVLQDLTIDTSISRTQYQFTLQANQQEDLNTWVPKILERLEQVQGLQDITSDLQTGGAIAYLNIDRDHASQLGIQVSDISNALYNAFGQRFISTIFTQSNQYRVVIGMSQNGEGLENLERVYLPNKEGNPIPLTAFAKIEERQGLLSMGRVDQLPATVISFNLDPNTSLGSAITEIESALKEIQIPDDFMVKFQGATLAFQAVLEHEIWLILAAVFAMYIVLGVLYESYIHPITILSTLPTAGVGALLALLFGGLDLSVIAIIGIILLIGIVKKNAIMMIDFALAAEREQGLSPEDAIYQACLLRFRPILMTTMAALLGAIPLMFSTGVGAELRQPLGVAMVGGLILSQILTLFTTPVIYLYFDALSTRFKNGWLSSEGEQA